ncbi:MAG: biotin synthase BioB [Candidatus Aceula meridiana]|nr:biotin synthase BioB [Candidatus Aceula meridiana]
MKKQFYDQLAEKSLDGELLLRPQCIEILTSKDIELLPLVDAAFTVRKKHWGRDVTIHIINNVQNGQCSEDCQYCAQSRSSKAEIDIYPMKSDDEIIKEAEAAYKSGAFRYCMVFSGKGQAESRIEHLVGLIKEIKARYPIEVCVSPGFVTESQAKILKNAGLNRLNHNINTSEKYYPKICTSHPFAKRVETLNAAKNADLDICSGVIVGMGEGEEDVVDAALTLRSFKNVKSIPVNFLLPIEGNAIVKANRLTPEYCLRVLCLYRFLNPEAEIRIAAGREYHLRDLQALALYPASSLFMDGYLNAKGSSRTKTLQMIKDAGFTIKSDQSLDALIENEHNINVASKNEKIQMKRFDDLHPSFKKI